MDTTQGGQRNTTRHREAAAASRVETRRRLVAAAADLFADRGYTQATVADIARRAGVSVQTVYLACGSKRMLLGLVGAQALGGTAGNTAGENLEAFQRQVAAAAGSQPDAEDILRAFASVFRDIAGRAAPWWRVYRDAAATDPEIAADWSELSSGRRAATAALLTGLRGLPGHTDDEVVDTVWAVASPETYDLLVRHAGYSLDAYAQWVADTLVAALTPTPGIRAGATKKEEEHVHDRSVSRVRLSTTRRTTMTDNPDNPDKPSQAEGEDPDRPASGRSRRAATSSSRFAQIRDTL